MANPTLTLTANLTWVDASGNVLSLAAAKSLTQTGTTAAAFVQIIGTTTEALVFPSDSVPPGYLLVKNIDPTNYVEFDLNTPVAGTAFSKLFPGEFFFLPTSQTTIYAKANTANVSVQLEVVPR